MRRFIGRKKKDEVFDKASVDVMEEIMEYCDDCELTEKCGVLGDRYDKYCKKWYKNAKKHLN
jgi:hypothetical protein